MSFWKNLFGKKEKRAESVVLIDVGAGSIAGAYALFEENSAPTILYTHRLPIEMRGDEPHERAMVRALKILGDEMIREGAPALLRATGSGRSDKVVVSIDTPWQETSVRTENFEKASSFTFTKEMVTTAMEKTRSAVSGKMLADESIIGTILNGYETHNPYGRKIHRATVIILSSLIDEKIAGDIYTAIHGIFHTKNVSSIAGSSLRYQAMRTAFPHERDALVLDATGASISIALIRKGLFTAIVDMHSTSDNRPWTERVMSELSAIAEKYPLPRIIFLLARDSEIDSFRQTLGEEEFEKLWLTNNSPKIIPVLASHIAGSVRQTVATPPDLQLLLMALYHSHCRAEE